MSTHSAFQERIDEEPTQSDGADRSTAGFIEAGRRGSRLSRYDLFLALLPLPLIIGLGWAAVTANPFSLGVGLGSLPTVVLLVYGLFVGGPTQSLDPRE